MPPKLSIIIPAYNIARYLDRCLASVVEQSFQDWEVLLVDDGSTDETAIHCDSWQCKDSRIKALYQPNSGVSTARNLGLDHAQGEFITFVDGDDYILPGMYERLLGLQSDYQADIAISGFALESPTGTAKPYCRCDGPKSLSQQEQLSCLFTNTYYSCSCWDRLFRREILEGVRFNPRISHLEDLLFCYEAMKHSKKAVFTAEPFYRYCVNDGCSAARRPFGLRQMTMLDVWDYILADAAPRFPALRKTIRTQYFRNYIMCSMSARNSSYDAPRIRQVLRRNVMEILCSPLAIGYKLQAIRGCI